MIIYTSFIEMFLFVILYFQMGLMFGIGIAMNLLLRKNRNKT